MRPSPVFQHIRMAAQPTKFCPGCGHGIVLGSVIRALQAENIDIDKTVFVSGIGCGGWISSPNINADTLHTTHGRAIAAAVGVKTARPDLNVIVISGDGDLATIGGNHLIHAARRDIDITVICANNSIYGMTGGQTSATTPKGFKTVTDPQGNKYDGFDLAGLVKAAGASYVARFTAFQVRFEPAEIAIYTGVVSIANNDIDENPYTFTIIGEGIPEPCYLLFIIGNLFFIFLRQNKK